MQHPISHFALGAQSARNDCKKQLENLPCTRDPHWQRNDFQGWIWRNWYLKNNYNMCPFVWTFYNFIHSWDFFYIKLLVGFLSNQTYDFLLSFLPSPFFPFLFFSFFFSLLGSSSSSSSFFLLLLPPPPTSVCLSLFTWKPYCTKSVHIGMERSC